MDAADLEDDDDDDNEVDEDSDGYAFLDADLGEPRDAAWEDASPESTLAVLFAAVAAGALLLIALRLAVVVLAVGLQGFKYGAVALVLVVAGLYLL